MFHKLNSEGTYPCEVVLKSAILKTGETEDLKFTAKFNRMDQDKVNKLSQDILEWEEIKNAVKAGRLLPEALKSGGVTSVDIADQILGGWGEDVLDANGDPLEYSEQEKQKVIRVEGVADAVVGAWIKVKGLDGDSEGKSPTSKPSRGNGIGK